MPFLSRRQNLSALAASLLLALAGPAQAQPDAYPSKPIRMVVGFPGAASPM
ncbi:hypothetical protein ACFQOZ_05495 [Comamonas endophytica]|uniref:hypothetical protein n=1 Tax=Comamonas endophytica TaxID=2949090 RepID=UPI00360EFFAF